MPRGTLEVLLVGANGLENTDFLGKMDPYVVLTYRTQEHKSSVAKDQGTKPDWNETFLFTVADFQCDLNLKIMDSDNSSKDDFVGEATIPVDAVLYEGNIPPRAYNVVKNNKFKGEINVALAFFPEEERCCEDY